eukprot:m.25113 g.25113  ORF g.25113 m.25113 type:complete len:153 (-) comp9172_c0_seq1:136-594(-)
MELDFGRFRGGVVVGDVQLQALLYFHTCLFPLWVLSGITNTAARPGGLLGQKVRTATYVSMFIVEVLRLYFGFTGNKREQVPAIVGFLIGTFVQAGLVSIVFFYQPYPIEYGFNIIFVAFIVLEVVFGSLALRSINKEKIYRFAMAYRDKYM